ncbi:hypothetical protein [Paraburkholderia sp.]
MKKSVAIGIACLFVVLVSGCVESARTGLVCPPGTHPGPEGHRCFVD